MPGYTEPKQTLLSEDHYAMLYGRPPKPYKGFTLEQALAATRRWTLASTNREESVIYWPGPLVP